MLSTTCLAAHAQSCASTPGVEHFYATSWGIDERNTRFQPESDIDATNVASLEVHWIFGLDENEAPHSYPLVTEDSVFIGTTDGNLYALDKQSGCIRWVYTIDSSIRTGVVPGQINVNSTARTALFFGTYSGEVFAVDAQTGEQIWRKSVQDHAYAMITGTPSFFDGKLIVPVSSGELVLAVNPFFACCQFQGSILSLNAHSGDINWRTKTIPDPPKVTGSNFIFVEKWGPSGAPIWSSPTIDIERNQILFGTGENYTTPASDTSDAIIAIDLDDGSIRWVQQYTSQDAFNMSCTISMDHPNCPKNAGPDLDFGASPIITQTRSGQPIIMAGQKSGGVYGINPVNGERLWERQFGRGGYLGGVHWGIAVNELLGLVFAPISDVPTGPFTGNPEPGLNALDIDTGEVKWSVPYVANCTDREDCRSGMSAAITATDDLVFATGLDGGLHAFAAHSGEVLWSYDTWRDYDSVNGIETKGGAIDVHGPVVAGDLLLIQSGYDSFGQMGGNALIAFKLGDQK
tara:strand:+ start:236 stop:1786 length:1551 start_codon:yes stop_codon:yes gene_type:complete